MINVSNKKFYVNFHVSRYSRDKLCHFAWDSHISMFACHGKCFFFPRTDRSTTGSWRRRRTCPERIARSLETQRTNAGIMNGLLITFWHFNMINHELKSTNKIQKLEMSVGLRTSNLLYHLASYFNFFSWLLAYRFALYLLLSTSLLFRWKNPENKPRIVETAQQKVESAVKAERKGPKVLVFMIKIFIWFSVPLLFWNSLEKKTQRNRIFKAFPDQRRTLAGVWHAEEAHLSANCAQNR